MNILAKYESKRNFARTPEPKPEIKTKNGTWRFVIQKHQATRLHFDFRIEAGGVLKSWAVPKGLPVKANEKRLAVMVEDHPLDYKDFEGVIPSGNYGAGTVMVWDWGVYFSPGYPDLKAMEKNVLESIRKGEVKFILDGEKMKGEFALIRTKRKDGVENDRWLMVRKKDEFSGKILSEENLSVKTKRTMEQISEGMDSFEMNFSGLKKTPFPKTIQPMAADIFGKPFDKKNWIFEIKWDGYRALAEKEGKRVLLYSRNNLIFNDRFPEIAAEISRIPGNFVLDGEIVVLDEKGKSDFQLLQNYLLSGKGFLAYFIFDILYLNGYDLRHLPLWKRKKILSGFLRFPKNSRIYLSEFFETQGVALFNAAKKEGIEGIIAKNLESPYLSGKRSESWLKIKAQNKQEAVVGGFTKPRGGRKRFGSLVLGVYKGRDLIYIGHSGGGFSEEMLEKVYEKLKSLVIPESPFKMEPKTNMPATWVNPELVVEVKFSEWTSDGIMRQPIFLGVREDKDPKEVRREVG